MSKAVVRAVEKSKKETGRVARSASSKTLRSDMDALGIRKVELDPRQLRKNLIMRGDELESATMAYNLLRTQVYRTLSSNAWGSLGITSSHKGEGKSLTALNLAFSLARSVQQDVILIDLDLRRPSIDKKISVDPGLGMGDYFASDTPLVDILFNPGADGLYIAAGRGSHDNASELLSSGKMLQLQTEIARMFPNRFVIYDLPPVLVVDDVIVISEYLDAMMLVATEGETKKDELNRAIGLLEPHNLLGVVLNKSSDAQGNGYYDYYGEK